MTLMSPWKENDMQLVVVFNDDGEVVSIKMPRPSDFHNHFRVGPLRQAITPDVSWPYEYMLAMPNTDPHIYTLADAKRYKMELMAILADAGIGTELIMTIYLSADTTPDMIAELAESDMSIAVKSYPPGATTNSGEAAPLLSKPEVLKAMEELGVRLLIHGECTHDKAGNPIDFPDREGYFYRESFPQVRDMAPDLLICCEHITTETAVQTVKADMSGNTVCTITPQHCAMSNVVFAEEWGGNHARCMPYIKGMPDMLAVQTFATSGDSRAILGTDCAPHLSKAKLGTFEEAACGCYTPHAMAMYATVFDECSALDERFVRFACTNGPDWWGLPRPDANDTIRLINTAENGVPEPTSVPEENDIVIPLGWTKSKGKRMPLDLKMVREEN